VVEGIKAGSEENLTGLLTMIAFGFVLGIRHACDADPVVAISTTVARHRSINGAALVGPK